MVREEVEVALSTAPTMTVVNKEMVALHSHAYAH